MLGKNRDWATARNDTKQVIPAATDTTAVLFNQFSQRNGHFFFNSAWVVDVTRDTEELGATVAWTTEACEPLATTSQDSRSHSNGFDVSHGRRATEQTDISGERRLQSRLALFAFDGFDQTGLFTANVCTGTAMNVDIEIVAATACVLADQSSGVSLVDSFLEVRSFVVELTTDVNVSCQ